MPVIIPDETLKAAGMNEREAKIEIACRLFAAQKLEKSEACRFAGLSRVEFEDELIKRGLPIIIYTRELWERDLEALELMKEQRRAGGQ